MLNFEGVCAAGIVVFTLGRHAPCLLVLAPTAVPAFHGRSHSLSIDLVIGAIELMPVALSVGDAVQDGRRNMRRAVERATLAIAHRGQYRPIKQQVGMSLEHPFVLLKHTGIMRRPGAQAFVKS